ncbi:MAG: helix-turn-helix domain-containing protein [Pirellulales bacterium]
MPNIDERKFLRDLGERLRAVREGQNLTQRQVAEKCNLHRTFIGSVERGERNVSVLNLRLIARVLRVRIAELLEGGPKGR